MMRQVRLPTWTSATVVLFMGQTSLDTVVTHLHSLALEETIERSVVNVGRVFNELLATSVTSVELDGCVARSLGHEVSRGGFANAGRTRDEHRAV